MCGYFKILDRLYIIQNKKMIVIEQKKYVSGKKEINLYIYKININLYVFTEKLKKNI